MHEHRVASVVDGGYVCASEGEVVLTDDYARTAEEERVGMGEGPVGPFGFI